MEEKLTFISEKEASRENNNIPVNKEFEDDTCMEITPWLKQPEKDDNRLIFSTRLIFVGTLATLLGNGAWIGTNGLFAQLPLLVEELPEGWKLPSYLTISVQLANIGPLLYWLIARYFSRSRMETPTIYIILLLGCFSAFLTAFLYQTTSFIYGEERSMIFIVLTFFISLVGCMSTVLLFPYMRYFKEVYMATYMLGEGLSGLLPGIIALFQGVNDNDECKPIEFGNNTEVINYGAKFSTKYFFVIDAMLVFAGLVSFYLMDNMEYCKVERVTFDDEIDNCDDVTKKDCGKNNLVITNARYVSLLFVKGIVCGLCYGFLVSIQSYSCLPYGNSVFLLAVTLSRIANPMACLYGIFHLNKSDKCIAILTIIYGIFVTYIVVISLMSPSPILLGSTLGEMLIVFSWVAVFALMSYIRLIITTIFRSIGDSAMFYCGITPQIGTVVFSVLAFVLVTNTNMFQDGNRCTD